MANRPIHVALVDDDASVRKALSRLLAAASFQPTTFGSAREFLESLNTAKPECLVVDLQMPEMSGLDLHRQLIDRGIRIPTVVITGHNEPGLNEECRIAGTIALLIKPFNADTLIRSIRGSKLA